jgi:uncharacterized membrane protein
LSDPKLEFNREGAKIGDTHLFFCGKTGECPLFSVQCGGMRKIRVAVGSGWAATGLLILAAPWLAAHSHFVASAFLYALFSRICHQVPERSFALAGFPLAVCHRCAGLYLGLLLGCFVPGRMPIFLLGGAGLLIGFDIFAPAAGLWANTAVTRFGTGLLFGAVLSSYLPSKGDVS